MARDRGLRPERSVGSIVQGRIADRDHPRQGRRRLLPPYRYSNDAEQICAGFWPGDARVPYPAFFAYGYPRPDGIEVVQPRPDAAHWVDEAGLFLLPYEAVRLAPDPAGAILEFLTSTYDACADRLGWAADLVSADPPPLGTTT
jgi:hypothetical protein